MKALALFADDLRLQVIDHPEPRMERPDHVRVRMLAVGICGTDREIISGAHGSPPPGCEYLILGHEGLGEVVETGPEVTGLQPGDLVVPSVRRPCLHPKCVACRQGRSDFCYTGDYTERGIKGLHGFMTEFIVEEARYLTRLPPELREVGMLVEPLTIAEKALIQVHDVQERLPWKCELPPHGPETRHACHRALVLGAGPVGLVGAMLFKAAGFETSIYSRSTNAREKIMVAESIGVRYVPAEETPAQRLMEIVGPPDFVYEAVGGSEIAFEVLKQLGRNGIFVFTGIPGRKAPLPLDVSTILGNIVSRNQVILGTVNAGPEAFSSAVRDLGRFLELWPDSVRRLISRRVPMEEGPELLRSKTGGIKNVIACAVSYP